MREDLFKLSFAYKKTKLWRKFSDSEVFALKLSNGEVGYIVIMGQSGQHCAIGVYVGEDGFKSYRYLVELQVKMQTPFESFEGLLQQSTLQVVLEDKELLTPKEFRQVTDYANKQGLKFTGKNAYPHFIKFKPNHDFWPVDNKDDIKILEEATQACLCIAEKLKKVKNLSELKIYPINETTSEVSLFELQDDDLKLIGNVKLPIESNIKSITLPVLKASNNLKLDALKTIPKTEVLEAQIVRLPCKIKKGENAPYYPLTILLVNKDKYLYNGPFFDENSLNSDDLHQNIIDFFVANKINPKQIKCQDERTFNVIGDLCKALEIKVTKSRKDLPHLLSAEYSYYDYIVEQMMSEEGYEEDELNESFVGDYDFSRDDERFFFEDYEKPSKKSSSKQKLTNGLYEHTIDMISRIVTLPDKFFKQLTKDEILSLRALVESGSLPFELEMLLRDRLDNL